jgi:beta-lactamase class A
MKRATFSVVFTTLLAVTLASSSLSGQQPVTSNEDQPLDRQLLSIAQAHHGHVALYAHNLKTGQTASLDPDQPVKTASVIKMGILLDAAEQIRAGQASLFEKLTLTKSNQVPGSGVIGQLTAPLTLTLGDTLHLMVVLSDNTATNLAIDRLGLDHINATLRAAGLQQTVLYKKVYKPAEGIGIGGRVTSPPLPHHRTCGSASGGSDGLSYGPANNRGSPSESK